MDKSRRKFLKYILLGSGAFVAGRILGPLFSKFSSAPKASAATIADLITKIKALQAKLVQLQAEQTGNPTAYAFTKNLYLGVRDAEVKSLQQYLNSAGYTVSLSGAGSVGKETNYYGPLTKAAVAKWQAANAVSPTNGYFGPISRAKYNAIAGTIGNATPLTPPPALLATL